MENLSNQDMIIFRLNQIRNEELTERTELKHSDTQLLNNREEICTFHYKFNQTRLREHRLAFKKLYSERILHNIPIIKLVLKLFKQYMWSYDTCSSTLKLVKKLKIL